MKPWLASQPTRKLRLPSITLKIDQKRKPETTLKSKVEQLKNQLFYSLLAQRLVEVQRTADFDAASTGVQLAHGLGLRTNLTIQATANSSQLEQVMKKLLSETYRVAQHGFGTEEFKRVSGHYRNTLQSQANGQSTFQQKHNAMLDQLILEAPYAGEENLATMLLAQLDDITVEDINDVAKEWLYNNDNRSVFLRATDDQADAIPSKKQVIKAWKKAAAASYEPYTESETIDQLISEIPEPGKVINYFYEKRYDAHLWRLSNGARVILKDRKFAEYGIWMKASSEGGQSKLDDKLYRASPYAGAIIDYMGVGDFSSAQLQRFLLDKNVNLKTSLTETHEVLSGSTTNEDLETFFQLLHLKFTQPRVNAQDYNFIKDQLRAALNSQQMKASWRFLEAVYLASNKHNPRSVNVFSPTALNFNSLDDTVEIYQDRFSDVGDFTFVFVGDIDKASIESLLKTYIASIPGEPFVEKETWQYREDQETKGHLEVHLKEGTENKASVRIELRGQQAWKSYSREVFKAGTSALQILLTEEIRENLSGTYAITVGQSISEFPEGNYTIAISFDCEPERVNELVTAVRRALTKAAEKGFSTEVITSAKQQVVEQRDRDMNRNKIWLDNLADISLHERSYILEDYKYRIAMTNVKVSKVNDAFKVFLRTPDTRYATLLPEGSEVEVEELGALLY